MIKRVMIAIDKSSGTLLPMAVWAANKKAVEITSYVCGAVYFNALEDHERKRTS